MNNRLEEFRAARVSRMLNERTYNLEQISAIKLLSDIYKNKFNASSINAFWSALKNSKGGADTYFGAIKKANAITPDAETVMQQIQQVMNSNQSQSGQGQPTQAPANPQKSEEIAKKADEIPQKAEQPVNNEYWHKVWTSLSNKAGSLNGQEELQKVVNNFVTELGRIVNK